MSNAIISARDLRKVYRVGEVDVHALRGVNLDVSKGEFLAIVGHSGSGKSTLFNVVGGLAPPSGGTVQVDGRDLRSRAKGTARHYAKPRSVVLQNTTFCQHLAGDNIALARSIAGKQAGSDSQFDDALKLLGISSRLKHKPRALSGGEQQRVAIARAIVNGPAILLADEPTGNLDTENSENVLHLMRGLNERLGQTIVMITHNPKRRRTLTARCI
ncbi:MAG: ABC transporter ATP-binding protein [Bryobacteraceae bacterium]